jgi:hypothetical protein
MNRREFSIEAALALIGGAAITIGGCGGGSSTAASSAPLHDVEGSVGDNHGHAAVITAAQLGAGGNLELDIQGTSSHSHMVSLSAAEVLSVRSGTRVQKESSGSTHTHAVTFNG